MTLNGDPVYGRNIDVIELRKRMGWSSRGPTLPHVHLRERRLRAPHRRRATGRLEQVCEESSGRRPLGRGQGPTPDSAPPSRAGSSKPVHRARHRRSPEVLLLDEPCSALDPIATLRIEELINELKGQYSVVIVTHNMQQAASQRLHLLHVPRTHRQYGPTEEIFMR